MKVRVFTPCCHTYITTNFSNVIDCPMCGRTFLITDVEMHDIEKEGNDATLHPGGTKRVSNSYVGG